MDRMRRIKTKNRINDHDSGPERWILTSFFGDVNSNIRKLKKAI